MQICKRGIGGEGGDREGGSRENPQTYNREVNLVNFATFREFKRMFICHKQNTYMNSQVFTQQIVVIKCLLKPLTFAKHFLPPSPSTFLRLFNAS